MNPAEILTRPAPPPDATIRYGPDPDNIADVRLPSGGGPRGTVSDLVACHRQRLGHGAAADLLGGGPEQHPQRYAVADPARLIPPGVSVRIVHGVTDDRVPYEMSRSYAARAHAAGDDADLEELPGCGHFEVIDRRSAAWPTVLAAIHALAAG